MTNASCARLIEFAWPFFSRKAVQAPDFRDAQEYYFCSTLGVNERF